MSEHKCRCAGCTKAKKSGVAEERERIIALLEAACVDEPACEKPCHCYEWEIALIKGENE